MKFWVRFPVLVTILAACAVHVYWSQAKPVSADTNLTNPTPQAAASPQIG